MAIEINNVHISPETPCLGTIITVGANVKNTYSQNVHAKAKIYFYTPLGDKFWLLDKDLGTMIPGEVQAISANTILTRFGTKFGIETQRENCVLIVFCNWISDVLYEWLVGSGTTISTNKTEIRQGDNVTFTANGIGTVVVNEEIGASRIPIGNCSTSPCNIIWNTTVSTGLGYHWFDATSSACPSDSIRVKVNLPSGGGGGGGNCEWWDITCKLQNWFGDNWYWILLIIVIIILLLIYLIINKFM